MAEPTEQTNKLPKIGVSNWITIIGLIFIAGGMWYQVNILQKDVDYFKSQWRPALTTMEGTLKTEDKIIEERLNKKIIIINDLEDEAKSHEKEALQLKMDLEIFKKNLEIEVLKLQHQIDILKIKNNKD